MTTDPIMLRAALELEAAAPGTKPKRLRVLAYSGGILRGVGGYGDVVIDIGGLSIPDSLPILADHDDSLAAVLGPGVPKAMKGSIIVVVTLIESEHTARVLELLEAGVKLQASVGVAVTEVKFVRGGEKIKVNGRSLTIGDTGVALVTAGELREVSIVPIGADRETEVRIAAKRAAGVETMEPTGTTATATATEPVPTDEAIKIADLTRDHPEIRATAVKEKWNAERTELQILRVKDGDARMNAEIDRRLPEGPSAINFGNHRSPGDAQPRDVLAAAVLIHAGRSNIAEKYIGVDAANVADSHKCRSLLDIFAAGLRFEHRDIPSNRSELIRASFSSVSMPQALGLSAEKIALDAYKTTAPTWRQFARIVSVRNFKETKQIRPIFGSDGFKAIGGGGELKHTTVGEQVFVIRIDTHGEILGITRQNVIDDDLGLFDQTSQAMGRDAARAVSDLVYKKMLDNLEPDGATPFFTTARTSLIEGADSLLSIGSLSLAVAALRSRRDPSGRNADITPKVLLVPPELESTARAILNSQTIARDVSVTDQQPMGNPFLNQLELSVEPRLSNTQFNAAASAKAWFVVAGPTDGAVSVGFLDGRDNPVIEQVDGPNDVLGLFWRAYLDTGCSLSDYLAIVKVKGEA